MTGSYPERDRVEYPNSAIEAGVQYLWMRPGIGLGGCSHERTLWRFFRWMCEPSKLHRWHFFFWITPRWLSKKFQTYMLRCYVERYPGVVERKIREALAQGRRATLSEEKLAALSKDALDVFLDPQAYKSRLDARMAYKRHLAAPHL